MALIVGILLEDNDKAIMTSYLEEEDDFYDEEVISSDGGSRDLIRSLVYLVGKDGLRDIFKRTK